MSTYRRVNTRLNSVLNMKVRVGAFNEEKALVGVFSVIVKTNCCRWIVCNSINHDPARVPTGQAQCPARAQTSHSICLLCKTTHLSSLCPATVWTGGRHRHRGGLANIVNLRRLHQSQLSFHRHPSLTARTLCLCCRI